MKSNKSPGPDNIYPIILKETKDEIVGALASLFNMSPIGRQRMSPQSLRKATEIYLGSTSP